jgi:hypothetical protein
MECLPPSKEFESFCKLVQPLKSIPPPWPEVNNSSSSRADWSFNDSSIVEALKCHTIYNFLIHDPIFKKAVKKFKHTSFYKNSVARGDVYHEGIVFRLMRILSLAANAYLVEATVKTTVDRKAYVVNRKSCIAKVERAERALEIICGKFPYYESVNLKKCMGDLKVHIESKTPSWFPERYSGYVAHRLAVWRTAQLFEAAFGEISMRVIKHLVLVIFTKDNIAITEDKLKEWLVQVSDEVLLAKNLSLV